MRKWGIVWNEWKRSPRAIAMTAISFVAALVNQSCWAAIIILLPTVFDDLGNLDSAITKIVLLAVGIAISAAVSSLNVLGRHVASSSALNRFVNQVENADYDLFTKLSCPAIIHASDIVWKIGMVGRSMADVLKQISAIALKLFSIYCLMPALTLPITGIYFLCLCGLVVLHRIFAKLDSARDDVIRDRTTELNETIHGFAEVRSFGTELRHIRSIRKKNDMIVGFLTTKMKWRAVMNMLFCVTDGVGTVTAILFLAKGITAGTVSAATAIAVISIVWELTVPIDYLVDILDGMSEMLAPVEKFAEVMEYQNQTTSGDVVLSGFQDAVEIQDLSFKYKDSESVLRNVNMTIRKGQRIGICGASGGGKTTLFKLLAKFYDPSSGSIKIDGINYRDLDTRSLRRNLGVVHQENHIFNGTIFENVIYGNWSSSEYDVIEACKKANLYDFIQSLPEKFQTNVGPDGLKLSGGQKQRIALARVFLSNAPIILLDEATSALDNESESLVQDALINFDGRTVITIAHRLSTIKDCDQIYVVDKGTIAEHGTHLELLEKGGVYASLQK